METNENNDLVMYIVLNSDLNMTKGKMVSQGSHAACDVVSYLEKLCINETKKTDICTRYKTWTKNGRTKIVLKATEREMEELLNLEEVFPIIDAGRTQVSPNSFTALAFCPNKKSIMSEHIKKFKLL